MPESSLQIEAVLFDTFGTTVDWRTGIRERGEELGRASGLQTDWDRLALEWRAEYKPATESVRTGERPWTNFDQLHRKTLQGLLVKHELELTDDQKVFLAQGWHLLKAWEDVNAALLRLRSKFIIGPLSNGGMRQLVDMAKNAGLPWDVIFGADTFHRYKPDPELYLEAVRLLDTTPDKVLMVAAHNNDLKAAQEQGMRTAFVQRENEDAKPDGDWDLVVGDFKQLADELRA